MAHDALDSFLENHEPMPSGASFATGEMFGDWRVTAFIGRGGSGEVYRVVHSALGTEAALKVHVPRMEGEDAREARARARFVGEAKLLSENMHRSFPRFLGWGERDGRPWYVMELLEPLPLPSSDGDVARFVLGVADGVRHLHSLGLVHRDIKPGNILWRAGHEPVLIDLGLVKEFDPGVGHTGLSVTVIDGKATVAGTPRYAAPEQMNGGEITPATDVFALGMLANECFGGKPPRAWERIIRRAAAAIPSQRYKTVAAFARAVRRRNWGRYATMGFCCALMLAAVSIALRKPIERQWTQLRNWWNAPVLDASAELDGRIMRDVRWFLDGESVTMPYRFVNLKKRWMPRELRAVLQKGEKSYSAKPMDVVPEWTGRKKLSVTLREEPAEGTPIQIWTPDGVTLDFVWCPPEKTDGHNLDYGFWIATKRVTGRQFGSLMQKCRPLQPVSFMGRSDFSSDLPVRLPFDGPGTVPNVSVPGSGVRLESPNVLEWKRGVRFAVDHDDRCAEWAWVPPELMNDGYGRGGWMKMDNGGRGMRLSTFAPYNPREVGSACVRYVATSLFESETNTVLFCTAQSLLRSKEAADVAQGERMMKGFFQSDDMVLKSLAMECCIERGISALDDFGTNVAVNVRLAAIRRGEAKTLERLAVEDPDPDIRESAYKKLQNPPQIVSARYVARIDIKAKRIDIKLCKVIEAMTERAALKHIFEHANVDMFRDEAAKRLVALGYARRIGQ